MERLRNFGLTRLEGELLGHLVLDWLYDYTQAKPGLIPSIAELAEHAERTQDIPMLQRLVDDIQQDLASRGLITMSTTLAGAWEYGLRLTAEGRHQASRAKAERKNPSARKTACRHALLLWLYEHDEGNPQGHPDIGSFFGSTLSFFYGYQFEISDIDRAAERLAEDGFIQRIAAWGGEALRARITSKGSDCVEVDDGDIGAYTRRHQVSGGQTINVHGDNSGQIGQAVHGNVTQYQQQGIDLKQLLDALEGVRDALPALRLGEEEATELTDTMDEIEEKGKTGTLTETEKRSLLKRVMGIIAKSTSKLVPFLVDKFEELVNA